MRISVVRNNNALARGVTRVAVAAALGVGLLASGAAHAQNETRSDAEQRLLVQAKRGEVDRALPAQLEAFTAALESQDMIAFLNLVDPAYFAEQFAFLQGGARPPGEVLVQFSCEFLGICSVQYSYRLEDVVGATVVRVDAPQGADGSHEIVLRFRMRDGAEVEGSIFYRPSSDLFVSAVG